MKFLLASFLLGIVSACGFEPWGLWPLTLLAFAALLRLVETAPSLRSALGRGYWFGVGNFTLGLNWIATAFTFQSEMPHWLGWIAVLLLSLYLGVYPAMATGLAWRWGLGPAPHPRARGERRAAAQGRPDGAAPEELASGSPLHQAATGLASPPNGLGTPVRLVLIFAAAWTVTEWLRATMFTGFAWNPVGVSLLPTPVSRLATIVGTYGLSAIALLLAGILLLAFHRRWTAGAAVAGALAAATALVALTAPAALPAPAVPLRIVQPNIGQQDKWKAGFEARNFARHKRLTGPPSAAPRLVLWPEAAVTDPLQDQRVDPEDQMEALQARLRVSRLLGPGDLLLTGGVTFRSTDGASLTSATNSVFVISHRGRILGRYDKAHLVPYGEYLPARPILSAIGLSRLAPGDVDFDPGPGPGTFPLGSLGTDGWFSVGMQVCYEIIFSGEVVNRSNRPSFIFNPSNDAWFGRFGPPQHLAQARLRALEEGLPVLRSTPTGISAVIDADGRLLHSLPWRTAGSIDAALPPPKPPTLFARAGNVMPFLLALLLVLVAAMLPRRGIAAARKSG
jgi:apolipoprotein N-acyltransferase